MKIRKRVVRFRLAYNFVLFLCTQKRAVKRPVHNLTQENVSYAYTNEWMLWKGRARLANITFVRGCLRVVLEELHTYVAAIFKPLVLVPRITDSPLTVCYIFRSHSCVKVVRRLHYWNPRRLVADRENRCARYNRHTYAATNENVDFDPLKSTILAGWQYRRSMSGHKKTTNMSMSSLRFIVQRIIQCIWTSQKNRVWKSAYTRYQRDTLKYVIMCSTLQWARD